MAVVFNATGLITNGACYTRQTLTPTQQKALQVYAKARFLALAAGPDYTTALSTTLLTDASQAVCGITPDQLKAGMVAVWMEAAAQTNTPIATKMDAIKCLVNADPEVLEKADAMLTAKIMAQLGY